MPFGYWEAKDEKDDLDAEIATKVRRGYPQDNIIFEDSTKAVLVQEKQEVYRCAVDDVKDLEKLLNLFFDYERAEITEFRKAVEQFKADLPSSSELTYQMRKLHKAGLAPKCIYESRQRRRPIIVDSETTLPVSRQRLREFQTRPSRRAGVDSRRYKEKKPKDPTIGERFCDTYRFANYKEKVIEPADARDDGESADSRGGWSMRKIIR